MIHYLEQLSLAEVHYVFDKSLVERGLCLSIWLMELVKRLGIEPLHPHSQPHSTRGFFVTPIFYVVNFFSSLSVTL